MGLNAFFTYTVVIGLGFTWQEALAMVFLCGLFNVFITVTKVRKSIIKAIPVSLQHAIGGGIGVFVAYLGFKNSNLITFLTSGSDIITVNGVAPADQQPKHSQTVFSQFLLVVVSYLVFQPLLIQVFS